MCSRTFFIQILS